MKKGKLAYRLAKMGKVSCGIAALSLGLFCCTADNSVIQQPSGALVLNLSADTAGVKTGSIATKALTEFDGFLDEKEYRVQVYQGSDTLQSAFYKDFPEKVELKEGNYILRAFKGVNLPAAFLNPYFEGTKEFTIKEGMKTPLDVTCTLANTRLFITYTDDFREAYTDCTVSLRTSYTGDVFLVPQTESRSVYLQSDKKGTDLEVSVSLKRASWTEAKTYTVTNPSIALKPQESVNLILSTDGKAGDGLALSIVLDDRMEELELEEGISDFMWKPYDKPTVEANGFIPGEKIEILKSSLSTAPYVAFGVPAGVGGLHVWRTVEGSSDTLKLDLTKPEDMKTAREAGFALAQPVDDLAGYAGTNGLLLAEAINRLEPTPGDEPYEFIFFASDNLPVTNYTDKLHLFVQIVPGAPVIAFTSPFPENGVVEGDALQHPVVADLTADGEFEDVVIAFSNSTTVNTYSLSEGNLSELGASLDINRENTKSTLTLPASFTESLDADGANDKEYAMTVTVSAKRGLDGLKSVTETANVKVLAPQFSLAMSANEGDVFAKRAVLRADLPVGNPAKLKFQKQEGGSWVDVDASARRIMEGTTVQVDTLKGLNPVSSYTIRAVYNSGRSVKEGEEYSFTTENVGTLPNVGFENWSNDGGVAGPPNWLSQISSPYRYWQKWFPWDSDDTKGWDTLNELTTKDGGTSNTTLGSTKRQWTRYVANSGTSETSDCHSGTKAALIRTVGWGSGNSAPVLTGNLGDCANFTPGELYLGAYDSENQRGIYGIPFDTRPSGFNFHYKYTPKNPNDYFEAEIGLKDADGQIIAIENVTGTSTADWTLQTVNLTYPDRKAVSMYIRFKSSANKDCWSVNKDNTDGPPGSNLSDSEYVGSKLYIDDVELIYE
ncbi:MAG: DUF4493 domain-containing protein [Parabacteroides sp.]|nr:DUF4493 domain-containing protein [Parabacteroides sp.]